MTNTTKNQTVNETANQVAETAKQVTEQVTETVEDVANYTLVVKQIRRFDSDVILEFTTSIPGYKKEENGSYSLTDTTTISINISAFTRQICEVSDEIALYRATQVESFTQRQLALIFMGAKIGIERTFHKEGEETGYIDPETGVVKTFGRDCFTTEITSVRLTQASIARIEAALTL